MKVTLSPEYAAVVGADPSKDLTGMTIECGTIANDCGPLSALTAFFGDDVLKRDDVGVLAGLLRIASGLALGCSYAGPSVLSEMGQLGPNGTVYVPYHDLDEERDRLTAQSGEYCRFVSGDFFLGLSRIWGFGAMIYDVTDSGWTRYEPPTAPLLADGKGQWLSFSNHGRNHWRFMKPTTGTASWQPVPLLMEVESDDIASTIQRALHLTAKASLDASNPGRSATERWLCALPSEDGPPYRPSHAALWAAYRPKEMSSPDTSDDEIPTTSVVPLAAQGAPATRKPEKKRERHKERRDTEDGGKTKVGANLTPPAALLMHSDAFAKLSEEDKVSTTWVIGHFPCEEDALLHELRQSGDLICEACKTRFANRSDRLTDHRKTKTHMDFVRANGARKEGLQFPIDAFVERPRARPDSSLYPLAVAYMSSVGINPSQIASLDRTVLAALVANEGDTDRREVPRLNHVATGLLDDEIRSALMPDDARVYLVVDGSSTSLADHKKVILVTMITPSKVYLLDPFMSTKSSSAQDYAEVLQSHMVTYGLTKQKIICIFTDGWTGNAKLARVLGLDNGQCQSHRFDLVAKVLHEGLFLQGIAHAFNRIMLTSAVRIAFSEKGLRPSLYQTQDHRFKHLAAMFADLQKNKDLVLLALQKVSATRKPKPAAPALAPGVVAAGASVRASSRKTKAAADPEGVPPAKRRRKNPAVEEEGDSDPGPTASFIRQALYQKDWSSLDLVIDFLTSGIDLVRLWLYNDIMEPISDIIDSSESAANNAPRSFIEKVDKFLGAVQRAAAAPGDIITYVVALTGIALDETKIPVPNGGTEVRNGVVVYVEKDLDDYGRLLNDITRTLQLVTDKLPQKDSAGGKDYFTYKLCELRDMADPRNPPPSLTAVVNMYQALKLKVPEGLPIELQEYSKWLKARKDGLSEAELEALKPVNVLHEKGTDRFPKVVHVLRIIVAAPVTVASVERAFSMLHHMAGAKRRNRLGVAATSDELRLRFHRDDITRLLHAKPQAEVPPLSVLGLVTKLSKHAAPTPVRSKPPPKTPKAVSTTPGKPVMVTVTLQTFIARHPTLSPPVAPRPGSAQPVIDLDGDSGTQ
jgi:hypothetical protein